MNMMTKIVVLAVSVGAVSAPAFAAVPEVVHAKLWNHDGRMGITTDVTTVRAGKVDFEVVNDSGDLAHEMLVVKVKSFDEVLPYNDKNASVVEDETNDFGEVSELEPGQSGSLEVNLKPGKYVLLCNVPGHYKSHMFADLLVTQ